ncbi:MAG TPA: sensor histidine kinase [Gemmatimonadales bacterium]|jgi:two-component system sensor histidine kinase UhpB|nr:sensor histidine kinase [Gemmatimonadales bacterium]
MTGASSYQWWLFAAAAVALVVMVVAFTAALVLGQRRFMSLQRAYGQRLLATQDEERAWVAREVHDDVAQRLAILRHEIDLAARDANGDGAVRRRLKGLEAEVEDLGVAVRRLAHRLHPATLDQGDLRLALEQLAEDARRAWELEVELDVGPVPDLRNTGRALVVYRIGQESLRNIARHAGTTRARITIRMEQGHLLMVVRDEGRGFDPSRTNGTGAAGGLGLHSMEERARQVGGSVTFQSQPGSGTTIEVRLPLRDRHGR